MYAYYVIVLFGFKFCPFLLVYKYRLIDRNVQFMFVFMSPSGSTSGTLIHKKRGHLWNILTAGARPAFQAWFTGKTTLYELQNRFIYRATEEI
jgi:hypothetical protein